MPIPFPGAPRRPGGRPAIQWPPRPSPPGGVGRDRVNSVALRDLTDDSGGRTEIIREPRDLNPATEGIASELSQQVLSGLSGAREKRRPLAFDPRRSEQRQLPRAGAARVRGKLECCVPLLATALGLSLLGSFGGLLLASSLLLFTDKVRTRMVPWLVSYAVGALLGVALLALLPEALETMAPANALGTLLAGILLFFVLEKLVLLRHCHTDECHVHGAAVPLVLLGDAFHNFIDGATVCAAVLTSVPLGVNTAIAVAAHEIPQEVGDVAILLAAGYSRRRALILNILSGTSGIAGALRRVRHRRLPARRSSGDPGAVVGEPSVYRDVRSDPGPSPRPDRSKRPPAGRADSRRRADRRRIWSADRRVTPADDTRGRKSAPAAAFPWHPI